MTVNILQFLSAYGVLLCTICKEPHCIPLRGVEQHLRDFHKDTLTKKHRAELVKYAHSLKEQLVNPKDVVTPPKENGPVPGLYKINGWKCLICQKLLGTEDSIQMHCRPHGWKLNEPHMWKRTYIQVFT